MNQFEVMNYSKTVEDIIDELTLFDDDLMSLVFDKNIEATNLLLRIILQTEDIDVIDVTGQRELENPVVGGRNVRLDIVATDSTGKIYDIEVQRDNGGAHVRRARFHSSMVDARMLKEKEKFKELRDSYVIFITQKDYLGEGLPLYHIRRIIEETGRPIHDGSHIIYVNGAYRGNDELGKLMHDFSCAKADDIGYEELKKGVRHFKEEGGRDVMCKAVEEYGNARAAESARESAIQTKIEAIKNLMQNLKLTLDQALQALGISSEDQEIIRAMIK